MKLETYRIILWANCCFTFFFPFLSFVGYFQVCREFQRGTCTRQPSDCRYAHPPENVTVDSSDNHVTVCMDFIKNKCTRDSCRYFHPPAHLQSQIKAAQQRANAAVASQNQTLVGLAFCHALSPFAHLLLCSSIILKLFLSVSHSLLPQFATTLSSYIYIYSIPYCAFLSHFFCPLQKFAQGKTRVEGRYGWTKGLVTWLMPF